MANLNTTQIAHNLLGPCQRVYHQHLANPTLSKQPHLIIDKLGAGDFVFVNTIPPGQNPVHSFEQKGLLTAVGRPLTAAPSLGHFAAVNLNMRGRGLDPHNITLPDNFVLTGTFIEPKIVSLIDNQPPPTGTYAPVLLLSFGTTLTGATSQFSATQQRLNSPFLKVKPNRKPIPTNLSDKVLAAQDPSPFTLVLRVARSTDSSKGRAMLFVGDVEADSFVFEFKFASGGSLTTATVLEDIRIGIGTTESGVTYRASVYVTEFEIWAPDPTS
jgi:hypothetical protein